MFFKRTWEFEIVIYKEKFTKQFIWRHKVSNREFCLVGVWTLEKIVLIDFYSTLSLESESLLFQLIFVILILKENKGEVILDVCFLLLFDHSNIRFILTKCRKIVKLSFYVIFCLVLDGYYWTIIIFCKHKWCANKINYGHTASRFQFLFIGHSNCVFVYSGMAEHWNVQMLNASDWNYTWPHFSIACSL